MLEKNVQNRTQVEIICLENLVPEDHLLREIDRAVDFSKIYEFVEDLYCPDNGRPSIDPVNKEKASKPSQPEKTIDNDALFSNAVRDSVFCDEDEIMPLVNISKDDENVIWKDDKVLVAFMNKYPDSYPAGEEIELKWGNVWCVSAAEMQKWVKNNDSGVENWTQRLHQVMGLPLSKNYTTVTALWVDANLLYRPANVTDPTSKMNTVYQQTGDEEFDTMYKAWFDSNIIWSYFDSAYPWTRLGYTYDWADNGIEYGLSEFLIFSGAHATVEYTYSIEDYVNFAKAG